MLSRKVKECKPLDAGFGEGDARPLSQVCLQMGFPDDAEELPLYLSGESRELGDNYPEMWVGPGTFSFFRSQLRR